MRKREDWEAILPKFKALAFRRGPAAIAREIPADRKSVYNWARGDRRPNRAAEARIREIISNEHSD